METFGGLYLLCDSFCVVEIEAQLLKRKFFKNCNLLFSHDKTVVPPYLCFEQSSTDVASSLLLERGRENGTLLHHHFASSSFSVAPGYVHDIHLTTAVHMFNLIAYPRQGLCLEEADSASPLLYLPYIQKPVSVNQLPVGGQCLASSILC